MPQRSSTYFHHWVDENEHLFIDFAERVKELLPYTKESIMFLLLHNAVKISDNGEIEVNKFSKKLPVGESNEEIRTIYKKAELLGKWLRLTGNEQTIYMFLKIRP